MNVSHSAGVSSPVVDNNYVGQSSCVHTVNPHGGMSNPTTRKEKSTNRNIGKSKAESVKSKSSFLLPGTKHHKKVRGSKLIHASELETAVVGRNEGHEEQATDTTVLSCSSVKSRAVKKTLTGDEKERSGLGILGKDARKSRRRSKHETKLNASATPAKNTCSDTKPVFGVSLDLSIARDPSHDGVPLPAFFRHCIDYIEEYGLDTEGIYRVPGVNSQVQSLLSAIDKNEEFPCITPTSATYYQQQQQVQGLSHARVTSYSLGLSAGRDPIVRHKPLHTGSSDIKNLSSLSRVRINPDNRSVPIPMTLARPQLPHDPSVVATVVKHFLRSLPEPILTTRLRDVLESVSADSPQVHYTIAKLIHNELPPSHRFLLAWMLQHITHIMDRSGENRMTLENITIVLSPCLRISHRLLAILLGPAPGDLQIDLTEFDPSLSSSEGEVAKSDPSTWHWLFPHPVYRLRPYRPPLRPAPDLELPETDVELESELKKQESLLFHLHEQIGRGETTPEKEALLWETQHLVTELRRRKSLCDPETIRAELLRQQAQLDRLHKAMAEEATHSGLPKQSAPTVSSEVSMKSDLSPQDHRSSVEKSSKQFVKPISARPDELWEVQRQVTMLKRRLKQQERMSNQQTNAITSDPCATTNTVTSGPNRLPIPTLTELDEEEVLNLTLRKLPSEALCGTTFTHDHAVPTQMSLPDATLERTPVTSLLVDELNAWHSNPSTNPRTIQVTISPLEPPHAVESSDQDTTACRKGVRVDRIEVARNDELPEESNMAGDEENITITGSQSQKQSGLGSAIREVNGAPNHATPTEETTVTTSECQIAQQIAFYAARKQELQAIKADLRARSWSEDAEIRRILSCINHLLDTGGERIRQVHDAHFTSVHLSSITQNSQSPGHLLGLLNRSWMQMATKLNDDECWPNEAGRPLLVDGPTALESSDVASSASTDSHLMTYSRMPDGDESRIDNEQQDAVSNEFHTYTPDTHSADDDTEECETDLVKTLLQLTLDNARLERLNARYLEGIQAERNRCAELKVLLKLRSTGIYPAVYHLSPSATTPPYSDDVTSCKSTG